MVVRSKKFIIILLAIVLFALGLLYYFYSLDNQAQRGESSNFKGPTGEPYVKGPGGLPPTGE